MAQWCPRVFRAPRFPEKNAKISQGVSSLRQGTYARRDWQTNFKSPAVKSHRTQQLGPMLMATSTQEPTADGEMLLHYACQGQTPFFFHKPHPDVCFFDVPSKVSHIITHVLPTLTLSCLRWLHQIVHLVFSWRSFCLLSLLYSSIFFHGLIPTSSGNESSAHFRRERPSGLALTLISARCSMSKRMFLGLGWLGAFRTVVFSSEMI